GMNGTSGTSGEVIPISSFTAFAVGPAEWDKADQSGTKLGPLNCFKKSDARGCYPENGVFYLDAGTYWRVCLDIVTSKGNLSSGTWVKQSGTIMAITRCVPTNEPESSDWNVFQNK
ncbi:MAG TPA: hypothetical protein VHM20_01145, partial [Gammaproteobacteria bacterium]|nr:hypothetical protein [Gammaproteobacteria bacterium]